MEDKPTGLDFTTLVAARKSPISIFRQPGKGKSAISELPSLPGVDGAEIAPTVSALLVIPGEKLLCTQKDRALVEYAIAGMDNHLFVSMSRLELPKKEEIQPFLEEKMREDIGYSG